jgi:hypothetical protein
VSTTLLVDGEPSKALIATAQERSADPIVLGAIHDRSLADRLLGTVATEVAKGHLRRAGRPSGRRPRRP